MRKTHLFQLLALLFFYTVSSTAQAFTEIVNRDELKLRFGNLSPSKNLSDIKIAVLDNSFAGFVPGKGMLPDSTELIEGPLKFPSNSAHGLGMAQILWAMTGQTKDGPKIYLVNTNGFTNFKAAVDFVIAKDVDIVLYSQVWLFGSNFDGKGFINAVVNKATEKGIIWINAAGNLGEHVYSGEVKSSPLKLAINNKLDENAFTVTLAWNNFGESENECSTKDLNLEILDSQDKVIISSELIQRGQGPDPKDSSDRRSCYARESVPIKSLDRGEYKVRVVQESNNFNSNDTFKVIITDDRPDSLEFTGHSVGSEIMPPADNATVITVGDKSALSSMGPTADNRIKPDFVVEDSRVSFSNGNLTQGSSNAAAMVAGSVAVLKSLKSNLRAPQLLQYAETLREQYYIPKGLINPPTVPSWLSKYVPVGGMVRYHPVTQRAMIFSKEAPLDLPMIQKFNLQLLQDDDLVACNEFLSFCGIYPKTQDAYIAPPMIEFRAFLKVSGGSSPGTWKNAESLLLQL